MKTFDFAIIGSGVSGGRMAARLTDAGASCILLEAGPGFNRKTFPGTEVGYSTQMFWGGGMEITSDGHLGLLRAKCLGGTSVVNQALLDPFDDRVWKEWQDISGIKALNAQTVDPLYERAKNSVETRHLPESYQNKNAQIFCKAFDRMGYQWKPLFRAQSECAVEDGSDCIVCLGGCPRGSKQSTLETSIPAAIQNGLSLETDFEVLKINEQKDQIEIHGKQKGREITIRAGKLIMAAGSLGNATILYRSGFKKSLPALGKGFSCHPQFMTFALFDEEVNAHKGAFQSVKSDDLALRKAGYKFENVFAQPIGTAMLVPGLGRDHMAKMKKYRHMASMEVCIQDENCGELKWKGGKLNLYKPMTDQDRQRRDEGLELVSGLFESVGAKEIIRGDQGFGLHLMGGCSLGVDGKNSVVSPEFSLHDHPRIFAADSSIFPSAPGINPSFSIMALTEWAADQIVGAS